MNAFTNYDSVDNNRGVYTYRILVSEDGTPYPKGEGNIHRYNRSTTLFFNDGDFFL